MIELRRRYSGSKGSGAPSFSRLPKEYQEVEYIENTFRAVLLIPIPNVEYFDSIKYKFYLSAEQTQQTNTLYSTPSTPGNNCMILRTSYLGGIIRWFNYTSNSRQSLPLVKGNYYEEEIRYPIMISNTSQINLTTDSDKLYNENIVIFAANYGGGYIENGNGRLYYFTIEGKINLVPCYRISDRKPGVYDIVNNVFYTNAGEGEFLYGQDVHYNIPPEYQQVEWLKSVGNAYLKLDFEPDIFNEHYLRIKFRLNSIDMQQFLIASYGYSSTLTYTIQSKWNEGKIMARIWSEINSSSRVFTEIPIDINIHTAELGLANGKYYAKIDDTYNDGVFTPVALDKLFVFKAEREPKITKGEVYEIIHAENNIERHHLYPCYRREDNVAGMYDLVSGEFYTNAGTGEFIVGPDVIG